MQQKPTKQPDTMTIGELADAAQVTRRVVRFYVQRQLLSPPEGRGRGSHYKQEHLQQLLLIQSLQAKGASLDAIRDHLAGDAEVAELQIQLNANESISLPSIEEETAATYSIKKQASAPRHVQNRAKAKLSTEQWSRTQIISGLELNINTSQHNLSAIQLARLQQRLLAEWQSIIGEEE